MPFSFVNSSKEGDVDSTRKLLLVGSTKGTIVKSLEIITGNESSYVHVIRTDESNIGYADIKIDMKANDYLVLWEGFFVIPYKHHLYFTSDSTKCRAVVNAVEVT